MGHAVALITGASAGLGVDFARPPPQVPISAVRIHFVPEEPKTVLFTPLISNCCHRTNAGSSLTVQAASL